MLFLLAVDGIKIDIENAGLNEKKYQRNISRPIIKNPQNVGNEWSDNRTCP
jgi:hypothetical protein